MHQTFDALFQLDERTVIGQAHNTSFDALSDQIGLFHSLPRILGTLFEAQRHPLGVGIKFQYFDLDFVTHLEHFTGMINTTPTHVRNVQQAINTAEIHKATILRDVLDDTGNQLSNLQVFQRFCFQLLALFLQQCASRQNNVAAFLVELDHFEFIGHTEELIQVPNRAQINL